MNPSDKEFYQRIGSPIDEKLLYSADNNLIHENLVGKLKSVSFDVEKQAKNFKGLNEDGLSAIFATALNQTSMFQAVNEAFSKGKVDITITCLTFKEKHEFTCLGEAKIWDGYEYVVKGVQQIDRYLTGRHKKGFMLYYFQQKNCDILFNEYLDRMSKERIAEVVSQDTRHAVTQHRHSSSGSTIFLDHFAVNLFIT